MVDKSTNLQIFGSLMKHPQYLSETDKYKLTPDDFYYSFEKNIFISIDSLYHSGATRINPIDIENFLSTNSAALTIFRQHNGIEFLQDADYLSDENNFPYYYKKLKKFNLLEQLKKKGFDTSEFYIEDPLNPNANDVNKNFENIEISDILEEIKKKTLKIERNFIQNDTSEVQSAYTNIQDVLEDAYEQNDLGYPLQGLLFNEIIGGARLGTLLVRSAASGTGKTRMAVADACYLAYPLRYKWEEHKWDFVGNCQSTLVIVTEQSFKEVQRMILAYLTGINESKFRYGKFNDEETRVINGALTIMEVFEQNLHIVRMPNPTNELIKNVVRENVLLYHVQYVFFDYIFICASLINEFKGVNLRNDEILLMLSTTLKDLAVELNIFIATSTQLNANGEGPQGIKNESSIAGSRAVINKADYGCIVARPSKEEMSVFSEVMVKFSELVPDIRTPNIVTDMYKVRSGQWTQVRIWSYFDLGTMRRKDICVTDASFNIIPDIVGEYSFDFEFTEEEQEMINEVKGRLNGN